MPARCRSSLFNVGRWTLDVERSLSFSVRFMSTVTSPSQPLDPPITPELIAKHGLTPDEFERIQKILGREPNFTELGHFLGHVERALLLQKLATGAEEISDHRRRTFWSRPARKTPASSTSATAGRSRSRSRATIIRARSSRSKARPPASAGSSATFSRWARARFLLNSLRFGPITRRRRRTSQANRRLSPASLRHRALRQLHRHPDHRRRGLFRRKLTRAIRWSTPSASACCGTSKSRAARPAAWATRFFMSARKRAATAWPARRLPRGI